jgi:mRNA interferase MazF
VTARPTEHGEIWEAVLDKKRPVVVVSRDDTRGRRESTTVAAITTSIRGLPTEVQLDHRDGLAQLCVVNCDELATVRKVDLGRRIGRLSETKVDALDDALRFALGLR